MKTIAASLLFAAAAIGANAYAAPVVSNETGNAVFSSQRDTSNVTYAQVQRELQTAKAPVSNEIGQTVFLGGSSTVSRAQVQQELGKGNVSVGLTSVYFGA